MRKFFFILSVICAIASCDSPKTKPLENAEDTTVHAMIPQSNCFSSITGKDSIWLKLEIFPNVATGVLKYQLWEKDSNTGTLEGKMEGNTFFGEYTFLSEGIQSVRGVAFLLSESAAIEGIGDQVEKDGKMVFSDKSKIDFTNGARFKRVDCAANDAYFQLK